MSPRDIPATWFLGEPRPPSSLPLPCTWQDYFCHPGDPQGPSKMSAWSFCGAVEAGYRDRNSGSPGSPNTKEGTLTMQPLRWALSQSLSHLWLAASRNSLQHMHPIPQHMDPVMRGQLLQRGHYLEKVPTSHSWHHKGSKRTHGL